ncbi:MAG: tRNA 2-thiouridine(34) synthase MnmA [Desulfobacter sp.]|nr:MAG: tRNA 2-thiouridine(34) synthase MnmA [Desulfobacter sp.]
MGSPVVAVALSGGIDSLVSGFLIKKAYKAVFGIHFTTGYEASPVDTATLEAQLGFKVHTIDLKETFEKEVVDYFISTYMAGKTPNPCLVCNRKIKFGALLDQAEKLGAHALATGHYARVTNKFSCPDKEIPGAWLEKGKDPKKDQSYFLALLSSAQLDRLIFPLGGLDKEGVRQLALENGLTPSVPSESQDICFIKEKNFSDFIIRKTGIQPRPGKVVDIEGREVGTHRGLHTFTIGQRRGINIPAQAPYYVKRINMADNTLQVCFKQDLAQRRMKVDNITWNYPEGKEISSLTTKIRYSHKGAASTLVRQGNTGDVIFDVPQNAVTPGQAAVFYLENRVLGAGIIR